MNELVIELNDVSLSEFYGEHNRNFKLLKTYFPKIKIVGRDRVIQAFGPEEILSVFQEKVENLIEHLSHFNKLSERDVESVVMTNVVKKHQQVDGVIVHGVSGKLIKPQTDTQRQLVAKMKENDMVFALGPAGTGKTYTAVALAVQALKNREVKRIIITRPAVEAGENLGFLPGDLKDKLDPYLQPLYDALRDMIPYEKLSGYIEKGVIEIAPLAFMRGRTLDHAFVILDEAQNTTLAQMKMFLTRMGRYANFIITGDPEQIDLPSKQRSGLVNAMHVLKDVKGIGFVLFDEKDVVRHPLVKRIIEAYRADKDISLK